jgi:hypothetical protein
VIQELLHKYRPGDWVVFRKSKRGTAPGPRAQHVSPSRFGEEYVYDVDKYWIVDHVDQQELIVRTRRGKRHIVDVADHRLRHARWWERLVFRDRFPLRLADAAIPANMTADRLN